jgi:hypothetical protein
MGRLRLQPREFRLRAGARSEVDRCFLQIVNHLPENINLSEFIKKTVVNYYEQQSKFSEADKLQFDFLELQEHFGEFVDNLQRLEGVTQNDEVEKVAKIKDDLENFIKAILESNYEFVKK